MEFKENSGIDGKNLRENNIAEGDISSGDANELFAELFQIIKTINANLSNISDENLLTLLVRAKQIIYYEPELYDTNEKVIPDYFIQDLNSVLLFSQIAQHTNNSEIIENSLIILQGLIYYSPIALEVFIQLDLKSFLMNYFIEMSKNGIQSNIISTILGIILKMSEDSNSHLEIDVIPLLFTFLENCERQNLNENASIGIQNTILIIFDIFGSFIRYNDKSVLAPFLGVFLNLNVFLQNIIYQKSLIQLIDDLAMKGFISDIIRSSTYSTCLELLNDSSYQDSYRFVIRLIIQILNLFVPTEGEGNESYELTQDNLEICVPFKKIYRLLKKDENDENRNDYLLLYEKISNIGGLRFLLTELNGKNQPLLNKILENDSFLFKSRVFHFLWEGLFKLNSIDQVFIMNSIIFTSMISCSVDFQEEEDDVDLLLRIFAFFDHILTIVPSNSNISGINGRSSTNDENAQLQLNPEAYNSINQFVNDCIECDNEMLTQAARVFMSKYADNN